jgi:hypothetical protein
VDAIIHCATSLKDTQGVDVEGTRALATSAKEWSQNHQFKVCIYISEAILAGFCQRIQAVSYLLTRRGTFPRIP